MYLYTEGGKNVLGGISDTQMQSTLATGLATANEAMTNSGIGLVLSLVHVGLVRLPIHRDWSHMSASCSCLLVYQHQWITILRELNTPTAKAENLSLCLNGEHAFVFLFPVSSHTQR